MKRYVALLRGINVGGKNKVPMPLLKAALEAAGLANVRTYINSGNVLFAAEGDEVALQRLCRQAIWDAFGLDIAVAVISAEDYAQAMAHAPDWWGEDGEAKHNAIFVIAPADARALAEEVGQRAEYEKVYAHGPVIFWSAPLKTFSRTRWAKVVTSASYGMVTIRNANTARKLLELMG